MDGNCFRCHFWQLFTCLHLKHNGGCKVGVSKVKKQPYNIFVFHAWLATREQILFIISLKFLRTFPSGLRDMPCQFLAVWAFKLRNSEI